MARSRERGWPAPPEPLPVAVVDNHTHLDTVVTWEAEGWDPTLDDHLERAASVGVPRMVQVGVVVDDGDGQRFRRSGPALLSGPRHHAWRSRSSSSSTIESSSLVNTGTGFPTGVPGTIGLGCHGATVRPSS